MIYTCTMSPSIDYTTYLENFSTGKLNRANDVYYYPGGKGINVSRVLHRLGSNTKALGFLGGFTGNYIEQFLNKENVYSDFIKIDDVTRINVKIKANTETELNGPSPSIATEDQEALLQKINQFNQGDWFVLAGSLPALSNPDFYGDLAKKCKENNVHFVLDTSGQALKNLILTKPFLIKPNLDELGELFETTIETENEAIAYARKLVAQGISYVIVSLGGEGALLVSDQEVLIASAPEGKAINTVGAGDSLVAGFIASYSEKQDVTEAFRYGVATGSATAFQTDLAHREDVEPLLSWVQITNIQE